MTYHGHGLGRPARFLLRSRAGWRCFLGLVAAGAIAVSALPAGTAFAGSLTLQLSPGNILFPDASPDLVPVIGPVSVLVTVKAVGQPGYPWLLTLVANSDLRSGPDVIPISALSWTASPNPPFSGGTLSVVTPRVVGSGIAHINTVARFDFTMLNSWGYNAGTYTATATFTLSAP